MIRAVGILVILLACVSLAAAESVLPDAQRTNGADTLKALSAIHERAAASAVLIGSARDKALFGLVVSGDGYILTQASDTEPLKPLRAFFADGASADVREVKRDDRLNLLLLKASRTGLSSVAWADPGPLRVGQWLWALTKQGSEIRLGVVSARRRPIPDSGAVLGARFRTDDNVDGVVVEELASDSPAQKAGLLANDVILTVNNVGVAGTAGLKRIMASHRPGDVVTVRYSRNGREAECQVCLASRRHVQMNWDGEDFANHGTSLRTDNFPDVIQHDLPLNPEDMGGAAFDLQGRAVALNIARVNRVTNFALPLGAFLPDVLRWIEEDRAKR